MPPSREQVPFEFVPENVIQEHFSRDRYWQRVQSGELCSYRKRHSHLKDKRPPSEPYCTHSQIWFYYTRSRELVAIVHQYMRPDGTLGASGRPDPKWLRLSDKVLKVRAKPPR